MADNDTTQAMDRLEAKIADAIDDMMIYGRPVDQVIDFTTRKPGAQNGLSRQSTTQAALSAGQALTAAQVRAQQQLVHRAHQQFAHHQQLSAIYSLSLLSPTSYYAAALELLRTDEPVEDSGVAFGEVRAWRCWAFDGGLLRSTFRADLWHPGHPMDGEPWQRDPDKTGLGSAGVHAWKTIDQALAYAGTIAELRVVVGQVDLYGDIVEHALGYRAERAAIVSLDLLLPSRGDKHAWWRPSTWGSAWKRSQWLDDLRALYGVEKVPAPAVEPLFAQVPDAG